MTVVTVNEYVNPDGTPVDDWLVGYWQDSGSWPVWIKPLSDEERAEMEAGIEQARRLEAAGVQLFADEVAQIGAMHEKAAEEARRNPKPIAQLTAQQKADSWFQRAEYTWINYPAGRQVCLQDHQGDCTDEQVDLCRCTDCTYEAIQALQAHPSSPGEFPQVRDGELGGELGTRKLTEFTFLERIAAMAPWKGSMSGLTDALGDWDGTLRALGNKLKEMQGDFARKNLVVGPTGHRTGPTKQIEWEIRWQS